MTELTVTNEVTPVLRPGYLTTEFWQTNIIHALGAVTSLLVLLHVNIAHLSVMQGLIPMLALGLSFAAQAIYGNKRARLKEQQLVKWAEVAKTRATPYLPLAEGVAKSIDPNLYAQGTELVHAAVEGWHGFPADATEAAVADGVPLPSPTDVPANDAPVIADDVQSATPTDVTTADPAT
jgi:hypothetical protein